MGTQPFSPKRRRSPQIFGSCLLWPNGWMDEDRTWYGGRPQPGDFLLHRDPAVPLPKKGAEPSQFSAHVYCGQTAGWIKMALGMEVGLDPGHFVVDGDQFPSPKKGAEPPFSAHFYCGQRLDALRCHLVWRLASAQARRLFVRSGPNPLPKKGRSPTIFGPGLMWSNGCMYQDATWYGSRPRPRPR